MHTTKRSLAKIWITSSSLIIVVMILSVMILSSGLHQSVLITAQWESE